MFVLMLIWNIYQIGRRVNFIDKFILDVKRKTEIPKIHFEKETRG